MSKKRIGDAGRAAEKAFAAKLGMRLMPASGAASSKGDMADETFLVEVKSTIKDTYSLSIQTLSKIHGEAIMAGKLPAFAVLFTDKDGVPVREGSWIAVPEWVWREMEHKAPE